MFEYKREYSIPQWSTRPSISVLVPVYNHSKYLSKSIQSILRQQDLTDWGAKLSIKVLNDGSTEPVKDCLKAYIEANLISYKEKQNEGLPSALNDLYQWDNDKSSNFRTWHSADNLYLDGSLLKMASFLAANPDLDFTFCNVQLINEAGVPTKTSSYRQNDQTFEDTSILNLNYPTESLFEFNDNFINACFLERTSTSNLLPKYRKECKGFEDYVHWLDLSLIGRGEHINLPEPYYQYRVHDDTMTHNIGSDNLSKEQKNYVEKALELRNQYQFITQPHTNILQRARGRYLGLFDSQYQELGRALIFIPEETKTIHSSILTFILQNPNLGIILFTRSEKSRQNADSLYLGSSLASNLRIVDSRPCKNTNEHNIDLLNALGSIDIIISSSCFSDDHSPGDLIEEIVLAASAGRVVFAPESFSDTIGCIANHYPWSVDKSLPKDIKPFKTDLTNAHYDAILRNFSSERVLKLKKCC